MRLFSILLGLAALRQAKATGHEYTGWAHSLDNVPTPSYSVEGGTSQQGLYDGVAEMQQLPPLHYDHPYGQDYTPIRPNEHGELYQQPYYSYPNQGMLVYDHSGASSSSSDQSYDYGGQWQEGGLPLGANLMQMYHHANMGDASTLPPPPLRKTTKRPPRSRVPRGTFGSLSSSQKKGQDKRLPKNAARFAEEDAAAQRLRAQIGHFWDRKGLWVGLQPKELAAGIIEIKLTMGKEGLSAETGPVIAQHIREHPDSNPGYAAEVSDWGRRYFSRMRRLKEKYQRETPVRSEEERDADIYKYARFIKSRDEYRALTRNKEVQKDEATKIKREAGKIWQALLEHCRHSGLPTIDETTPMKVVEEQSRYLFLFLEQYTPDEVADYIRFYLLDVFHKTPEEVDEFNRARNECLQAAHLAAQRDQQKGHEGEVVLEHTT